MFYKPDTIEIVYTYLDSTLLATDSTYPNASHMQHLGYLITTQDSIVMKRYAQSLSRLLNAGQSDTVIYLGFRKYMFTQDCAAWKDNLYMSYSGVNATNNLGSISLEIYPNPGIDRISFRSEFPISEITLSNMLGQVVLKKQQPGTELNVSELPNGVFFYEIVTNGQKVVGKWVKRE